MAEFEIAHRRSVERTVMTSPDHIRLGPATDGIVVLTLDRPDKRNALSIALRDEVSDALDTLAADERVKVVVITGAGGTFSAGFDLREFEQALDDAAVDDAIWTSADRFHQRLLEFPLPLLAAVDGPALAGGFDLAVCCDLRVASTTARFSHPETTFGDVMYSPLHDLVGGAIARELCLTGREVDADEALRLHLVSQVCAPEDLAAVSDDWARQIARAPRELLLRTKAKIVRRAAIGTHTTLDL
jgi:enoyl-CoA hydratase